MGKVSVRRWLLGGAVAFVASSALVVWWFSPAERQKRRDSALVAAARLGDVGAIEAALSQGADVNCRDADGITPLMHAARGDRPDIRNPGPTDHPEAVELLIRRGAGPNVRTKTGFVALFWAARYGHDKVARVLIDHGADVNVKDADGLTAMRWASTNQQSTVVSILQESMAKE